MSDRSSPARVLIVRLSHLGDVVHALCVFHALHDAYPAAEIAWTVQPEFAPLLEPLPGLSRVIPFGRREGWRAWPRVRAAQRAFQPDLVVDAQGNLKSAAVTWCAGAPLRSGLARSDWREPLGVRVLNDPAPPRPAGERHAMDRMLGLARHVAPGASHPPRTDPGLTPAEAEVGEKTLDRLLPAAGDRSVLLHLSSMEDVRSWPAERWHALAVGLADRGVPTLILSGPKEEALGRQLADHTQGRPELAHEVGQRGLRELAALFHAAGRRGARLVTCDSGPMHLACATGLDVLALEGPQDAARTGPWPLAGAATGEAPGPHRVVRAAAPPDCAPCLGRRCTHERGPVCMLDIGAEQVLRALDEERPSTEATRP